MNHQPARAPAGLPPAAMRYHVLTEMMPQLVWVTDPEGQVIYFNRGWYEYTGQSEQEALGFGFADVLHPDDRERTLETWRRSWHDGEPYEIEYRLRRHDGAYHWFIARATPVYDSAGALIEWVGTCTNVDDQKRSSLAFDLLSRASTLFSASADYRGVLRQLATLAVPDFADWCAIDLLNEAGRLERLAVAHIDPEKMVLAEELARLDPSEGQSGLDILRSGQPVLLPVIDQAMLAASATGPEHLEKLIRVGMTSAMILPLVARGAPLGVLTLVAAESRRSFSALDLTLAERLAERIAVALDNARLYQELRQFRVTLDQTLDCVFMFDPESLRFFYVNQGAIDQVGYSREQLLEMTPLAIKPLHSEESFRTLVAPLVAGEQRSISFETVHRHQDGHDIPVEVMLQLVAPDDEPARFVAIVRDITERRRAAAALEERNQELDQFAYLISHDLKAPLRGIANLAQWIDEDLGDNGSPEVREHLNLLHGRARRMEGLINGLLAYSRVGRTAGSSETVDVAALLEEVVDLLAPPDGVEVRIGPGMPQLRTERLLLQQVFANLVGNAIKHHPGPEVQVEVQVAALPGRYRFSVIDNGPGIDPSYHERIFGLFQTLVPKDRVESSGIGLAMVKKIVEHLGGEVELRSAPGAGSTFTFTWPA